MTESEPMYTEAYVETGGGSAGEIVRREGFDCVW